MTISDFIYNNPGTILSIYLILFSLSSYREMKKHFHKINAIKLSLLKKSYDKILKKVSESNKKMEEERFESSEKLRLWNELKQQFTALF